MALQAASSVIPSSFHGSIALRNSSLGRSGVFEENALSNLQFAKERRGRCVGRASPALLCVAVVWWSDAATKLQPDWQKVHLMRVEKLKAGSLRSGASQSEMEEDSEVDYLLKWTEMLKTGWKQLLAAGLTPEMIIGRTAMLGFFAATTVEFETGKSVLQQLTFKGEVSAETLAVAVALMSLALHEKATKQGAPGAPFNPYGLFTPTAERLNGQAAMLGFVLLIAIESAKGSALF